MEQSFRSVLLRLHRAVALLLCVLSFASCLPESRLNAACRWNEEPGPLPDGRGSRRRHLVEDVHIAHELAVRYADSTVGRNLSTAERDSAVVTCTMLSFQAIARQHGISSAAVESLRNARLLWIDFLFMIAPIAVLFSLASRAVARRIVQGHERDDRALPTVLLALFTPVVAGFGVVATHMWGWIVESIRVRNGHISGRAFQLPASTHAWELGVCAMVIFGGIAVWTVRREPVVARGRRTVTPRAARSRRPDEPSAPVG